MDPLWTEELLEIKDSIEHSCKTSFNSVLINFYRDGKDRVAWHSDDEKELGENPIIGSVSLGAEEFLNYAYKKYKSNNLKHDILLKMVAFSNER